ncbi:MAG: hypothetical protein ACE14O_04140 [Candidatus Cloacimonadaceae bacterium]
MRCSHCNEKLAVHDLWCAKCGRRTEVYSKDLSAVKSLKETWNKYKPIMGQNFPVGIWAALTGILPLIAMIIIFNYFFPSIPKWYALLIRNVVFLFFLPVLFVPFHAACAQDDNKIKVKDFFHSFTHYDNYWIFSLISVLYYLVIYFVCKGDPILNLVWLVLVMYWVAIVIPVPILMERYRLNAWQAIKLAYKKAGDVRWHIFALGLILMLINLLAAVCLVIGLCVTVPFTWFAIRDYTDKLIEYELFYEKSSE